MGRALTGERREGLEIFTKVFWPTGPGRNDRGLSRKHIMESINGSLRGCRPTTSTCTRRTGTTTRRRWRRRWRPSPTSSHSGKALYIGVSEWKASEIRAAKALADELKVQLISNQPQYSMLWRVIEAEVVPTSEELGLGQIVWSPIAQGMLTGKYLPGAELPAGSRATDENSGANVDARPGRQPGPAGARCSSSSRSPRRSG